LRRFGRLRFRLWLWFGLLRRKPPVFVPWSIVLLWSLGSRRFCRLLGHFRSRVVSIRGAEKLLVVHLCHFTLKRPFRGPTYARLSLRLLRVDPISLGSGVTQCLVSSGHSAEAAIARMRMAVTLSMMRQRAISRSAARKALNVLSSEAMRCRSETASRTRLT
jgi:hypothetical protein